MDKGYLKIYDNLFYIIHRVTTSHPTYFSYTAYDLSSLIYTVDYSKSKQYPKEWRL